MYEGIKIYFLFFSPQSTLLRLAIAGNAVATETKKAHLGEKKLFFLISLRYSLCLAFNQHDCL